MTEREQQAELLDRYWATLRRDLTASPPGELDRELAEVAERLERHLRPPEPNAGFARDLRRRLDAEAAALAGRRDGRAPRAARRWPTLQFVNAPRRWWPLAGFATAAALLVALVGVAYWISRPQPVSAQEILDKAQAAAADVSGAGVRSFAMVEVEVARGPWTAASPSGEARSERHVWFKAPNRWRYEVTSPPGAGQGSGSVQRVTVADGETIWTYDSAQNRLRIAAGALGGPGKGGPSLYGDLDGQGAGSLDGVLKQARTCYDPVVAGEETVAGRRAYVVKMGATTCPSASGSEMNGPRTVWVDKETFFVLKNEIRGPAGEQVTYGEEVTSIRYNVDLPDDRFTYSAPPGATVRDTRPKPAPSADEFRRQVEAIARQADFPIFTPGQVPQGLVPRQPRLDPSLGLQLEYVPADEAATDAPAQRNGLSVVERRASYSSLIAWTERAESVPVPGGKGWLRRGVRDPEGTGSNSAAIVLRDGTLISVAGFGLAPEQLLQVATSLEAVPGGHPPLPEPIQPALAGIRQRASFPVFVPTWVPDGLTPEPPVGGERPNEYVGIDYHAPDGGIALRLLNGPAGCCLDADPRKRGRDVPLSAGLVAHFLNEQPEFGGPILWWHQAGAYVSLSGPQRTKDELVKIAASMSQTADLGQTQAPPARPTPTPVPTPGFTILRPTWLPEPMTVREQVVPNPFGPGSGVKLTFDPRPGAPPHALLTLEEFPVAPDRPAPVQGPQAGREQIGGREVTIGRRGEGCVTASWVQGEVALVLHNPYDPPGPPGAVRYSCDQFRRIIESVR